MSVVDAFIQLRTDQRALKDDVDAGIRAAGRGTAPRTAGAEAGRNFASNMTGKIESETRRSGPRFIANWAAIGSASGHGFSDKFTSALRPMRDALDRLSHRVVSPKVELAGRALTMAGLDDINRKFDRLNGRTATMHVKIRQSISGLVGPSLKKAADSSFLKPSGMGIAAALSPALIPLAAGIAAGVGAIGVSFGAAALGAGVFGLAAKSVLAAASTNLTKLQALELALNKATTPAAKKSAQAAIAALKATWAPGYLSLLDQLDKFHQQWTKVSQTIAVPALSAWLPALTKGMPLLATAVKPVAAVFQLWGRMLRDNFANPAVMKHLQGMAAAFGKFSAGQLTLVGRAIADIAFGLFHLGKDLAGSGANFSSAGIWINSMGTGFLTWSKSAKARADVQGFMHYLHREGPVVKGILQSLGKILPGIFKGASAAGTLELQAVSGFLGLIARLPKGWQQPLTEAAGAMLLLSKTGVLSIGLKVLGGGKGGKGGAVGRLLGTGGLAWAVRGGLAFAAAEILLKVGSVGTKKGQDPWNNPFGADPKSKNTAKQGVSTWAGLGNMIVRIWDKTWANTITRTAKGFHELAGQFDIIRHVTAAKWDAMWSWVTSRARNRIGAIVTAFDGFRHSTAVRFDAIRHDVAHIWDVTWSATVGRLKRGIADLVRLADGWRRNIAAVFTAVKTKIAATWDATWNATVGRVKRGVGDVLSWVGKLPGRIKGFFFGASHWLTSAGREVLMGLWDGMTVIWHKVTHFISSIAGWIKAHKGPVSLDAKLLEPAGRALMKGLHTGLTGGFGLIKDFIGGTAGFLGKMFTGGGSGVQRWAGLVQRALSMLHLSPGLLGNVLFQMQTESGGDPNIVNTTDINAQRGDPSVGLMQVIGSTFRAYAGPFVGLGQRNPFANIFAALAYAKRQYGPTLMSGGMGIGSGHGYAAGTLSARRGWAWTGERGPELVGFAGGETVLSAQQSRRYRFSQPDPGDATLGDVIRELTRHRRQLAALAQICAAQGQSFGREINGASHTAARSARHSVS